MKARICRTLKWDGFPSTAQEFKGLQSLKTHDLDILLRLSGMGARVKDKRYPDWSVAADWSPESRYRRIGTCTEPQATEMVAAAHGLLEIL